MTRHASIEQSSGRRTSRAIHLPNIAPQEQYERRGFLCPMLSRVGFLRDTSIDTPFGVVPMCRFVVLWAVLILMLVVPSLI